MSLNQRLLEMCGEGEVEEVTSLISVPGVNINHVDSNNSPLTLAIINNHPEIYNLLLNHHHIQASAIVKFNFGVLLKIHSSLAAG